MPLCPICGWEVHSAAMCEYRDEWPQVNRIMCDLVHRGIEPRRLAPEHREEIPTI